MGLRLRAPRSMFARRRHNGARERAEKNGAKRPLSLRKGNIGREERNLRLKSGSRPRESKKRSRAIARGSEFNRIYPSYENIDLLTSLALDSFKSVAAAYFPRQFDD